MARKLDFNSIIKPMIEITLRDEAHTVVHVTTPTEGLIEKLASNADTMKEAVNGGTAEAIKAVFELMAELTNCNLDGIKVTAEELRDKYGIKLFDVILFFNAYMEFIEEIKNAKN
jgi:hypothetical protein